MGSAEPQTGCRKVAFFHDTNSELWEQFRTSLAFVVDQCKEEKVHSGQGIAKLISDVRRLNGDEELVGCFGQAMSYASSSGICSTEDVAKRVIPFVAGLARDLPELFPEGLQLLVQNASMQVFLTRRQCAALLAAGIFGAVPLEAGSGLDMPSFDFYRTLQNDLTKSLCLLCYFAQVSAAEEGFLEEKVSFARRQDDGFLSDALSECDKPLSAASVATGSIEDSHGSLQADFANEYLGGGVLMGGNVQEEIRFSVCPECLVGLLFCEKMLPNEAIFIVGAQQFSKYNGYGGSFSFDSPYCDVPRGPADAHGRVGPHIVALDALVFPGDFQYGEGGILRELNKAYVACLGDPAEESKGPFATGNWGCGVFGGDPQIKSLIQWLAASLAGRDMLYFPYGDRRVDELQEVLKAVQDSGARCRDLYELLTLGHSSREVFSNVRRALKEEKKAAE